MLKTLVRFSLGSKFILYHFDMVKHAWGCTTYWGCTTLVINNIKFYHFKIYYNPQQNIWRKTKEFSKIWKFFWKFFFCYLQVQWSFTFMGKALSWLKKVSSIKELQKTQNWKVSIVKFWHIPDMQFTVFIKPLNFWTLMCWVAWHFY